MGKRSPFLTGKYKHPSLRDWDVKMANQDLQKVYDVMGLEHGLTAGVTQLNTTHERPFVLCFDPNTCPLSEVRETINIVHETIIIKCIWLFTSKLNKN
jgi:hypothetical protein